MANKRGGAGRSRSHAAPDPRGHAGGGTGSCEEGRSSCRAEGYGRRRARLRAR
eukprot:CAMPEP_0171534998 /NCGR_PEP_ID=MMETSP0959-20130129/16794_1 /TAXON_ID=87120 /ORGANISM="Aurantiochytrium limacinum, Strain ATCCMYA-1381" /LENGTH=52 /DNA_ID=CAMNT_0012080663 /DNA_START=208 /DNA_END=363 /DNA_ORIENTATION=-